MKSSLFLALFLLLAGAALLRAAEEVSSPSPVTAEENVQAPPPPAGGAGPAAGDTSAASRGAGSGQPAPAAPSPAEPAAAAAQPPAGAPAQETDIKPLMQTVKSNFQKTNYEAALKAVDMALALKPEDSEANKYKGMILYRMNNLPGAEIYLKLSETAKVRDAELVFYLGALYDKKGDFVAAEREFLRYPEFRAFDPYRGKMKKYAGFVGAKAAKQRAKEALLQEAKMDVSRIAPNTVTVVTFANTGANKDLDPLSKGLAEMIATDLSKVERLQIVERVQMQALVNEMALGQTGLLEARSAERFGKLAGAEKVINGSFGSDDGANLKMDAGLADVRSGELRAVAAQNGTLTDLFRLEKALTFKIIDGMGIVLTEKERKKINALPTQNVMAFLAYSKGLDAEARGDYEAAKAAYADAVNADPKFSAARTAAEGAAVKADCAKNPDLTQVQLSSEASAGAGSVTTPVFTIGGLSFSAKAGASLFAINSVTAAFMAEKPITASKEFTPPGAVLVPLSSGATERISYIDDFNYGFGSGSKSVPARVPIPQF